MSQAFTATEPSITLEVEEAIMQPDIERNGSTFTDGIGDISKAMAKRIVQSLRRRSGRQRFFIQPSAFQFRMGGLKGILCVNPNVKGYEVLFRPSQSKFTCTPSLYFTVSINNAHLAISRELEIAQCFFRASEPCCVFNSESCPSLLSV